MDEVPNVLIRNSSAAYEYHRLYSFNLNGQFENVWSGWAYDVSFYSDLNTRNSYIVINDDEGISVYLIIIFVWYGEDGLDIILEHLGWAYWRHYPDDHIIPFDLDSLIPKERMTEIEAALGINF